ncbi:MAG: TetR/AcrR family transcriptional regulator [Thermomicrobiales bacterium]|nr:MAG: TetR/AcrR family transcriptional regulator [Thermomicrobiales bacterium]
MTTTPNQRTAGRPRLYSDADIFGAINRILTDDGFSELTLDAVATRVGCTRQALVRRFGSKDGMVLGYLDALLAAMHAEFRALNQDCSKPLETLLTRYTLPPDQRFEMSGDPAVEANLLAFVLSSSSDPLFAGRIATLNDAYVSAFQGLLDRAVAKGELQPCATRPIALCLHAAWIGEIVHWCFDPRLSLPSRLSRAFELIVAPHRAAAS